MKKNNKQVISSEEKSRIAKYIQAKAAYFSARQLYVIIIVATFLLAGIFAFLDTITRQTVAAYSIEDYAVGQVADKTVIAEKALVSEGEDGFSIVKGEKIIRKGFVISADDHKKLELLAQTPSYIDYRSFYSQLLYLLLLTIISVIVFSAPVIGKSLRIKEVVFLCVLFLFVFAVMFLVGKFQFFSSPFALSVIIPSAFCIMLVDILINKRTAIVFTIILSFATLAFSAFSLVPALYVLFGGLFMMLFLDEMERRIDLVFAAIFLAFLQSALMVLLKGVFPKYDFPLMPVLVGAAFSGFISGILAIGFLTPLESILNTASTFRLMDLSDLNSPLMRRMLLSAPGTYNHSLMVATLAENACSAIGANPLLARVGAYYHDLGKMEHPEYFVENQRADNKHNEINPRLSVSIIRRHVKGGVEKARQLRLPEEVIAIIAEHHGNSLISYFFHEAKKLDENVSPEEYSYIGTPPSSKESAVVMLADTVEAACRTLDKPSVSRLEKFIRQLVMNKIEHRQLDNSNLTFKELDTIQASFVKILAGYYHSRIEYPNQKDPDDIKPAEKPVEKPGEKD